MDLQAHLRRQLEQTRAASERLLAGFADDAWTYQVRPGCNHALWFVGHMAHADDFFLSLLAPELALRRPEIAERFGVGSEPSSNRADYPPPAEVLGSMRERRAVLLRLLDGMTDEDLARPNPPGTPPFLADAAAVFAMAVWHEGLHAGQLTVVRRALGMPPVLDGPT